MRKYFVIQCYTDTNRRKIMYQVQNHLTGEITDFTDDEWAIHQDDNCSYEEAEAYRAKLRTRTYIQAVEESKAKNRKRRK